MSHIQIVVWYSDHHLNTVPVSIWWSEYQTKYSLYSNGIWVPDHSGTGQLSTIWILDLSRIKIPIAYCILLCLMNQQQYLKSCVPNFKWLKRVLIANGPDFWNLEVGPFENRQNWPASYNNHLKFGHFILDFKWLGSFGCHLRFIAFKKINLQKVQIFIFWIDLLTYVLGLEYWTQWCRIHVLTASKNVR